MANDGINDGHPAVAVQGAEEAALAPATMPSGAGPVSVPPVSSGPSPKFVTGSLLRHLLVMTGAGAAGLMAIFVGDLANLVFLSWLKDEAVVAAVGYGSSILFLTVAIGIGLAVAAAALISPAIGARDFARARRLSINVFAATTVASIVLSALVWVLIPWSLRQIGASGRTYDLSQTYLSILVPSLLPLALGMTASGILRSVGDARRSMNVTLSGAIVNVILDPIFIFGFGWGLEGAAWASVLARLAVMATGLYGVIGVHKLIETFHWPAFRSDVRAIAAIAVPAILANVATPFSNAYVTSAISHAGDGAVAGWTIVGRILPVAFGAIYALSGTVGPILGQNYGAGDGARMREAFVLSLKVTAGFTIVAWLILLVFAQPLATLMAASGDAREIVVFYCRWLTPLFFFLGALFVSNAVFNTLGRPQMSMMLNWGRASLGTVPFVIAGTAIAGAKGILAGHMIGGIVFGLLAVWLCYRMIVRVAAGFGVQSA